MAATDAIPVYVAIIVSVIGPCVVLYFKRALDRIHVLVNSNLTAAIRGELDATMRDLASLEELTALHAAAGRDPSSSTLKAIATAQASISRLQLELSGRTEF